MKRSDYARFYNRDAKGFSAERNNAIIEETIKEYEAMRAKKAKEYDDHYAQRADAILTYLKSIEKGGQASHIEKYFGKKLLAQFRGQQIRDMLMKGMTVKNKQGVILKQGE